MQICQDHWTKLRAAIDARGIGHLVKDAAGAVQEMHANLAGREVEHPDPLLAAHNMILSNAVRVAGFAILFNNEDGSERCPLCFLIANCACGLGPKCHMHEWIDRAADDALGLVSGSTTA